MTTWRSKIKRFSIRGRRYWYITDDGGLSWRRISTKDALQMIEAWHRADGDARPERGPGFSDTEWVIYLCGWDAHADAVRSSGLRTALARVQGGTA